MEITYIDENICLCHEGKVVFISEDQANKIIASNSTKCKFLLKTELLPTLTKEEQIILNIWLSNNSVNWNVNKIT